MSESPCRTVLAVQFADIAVKKRIHTLRYYSLNDSLPIDRLIAMPLLLNKVALAPQNQEKNSVLGGDVISNGFS